MDQHEKYLYDLQGYITVPDALDADQLRRLNEEVDRHIEAECPSGHDGRTGSSTPSTGAARCWSLSTTRA